MKRSGRILFCSLMVLLSIAAAKPPAAIHVVDASAYVDYPADITFSIEAESESEIRVLELEYGLTGRDCTPDVNIVVPEDFIPAGRVDAEWTFDSASAGNLPPGMRLWWDWRLVDASGNEIRTDREWITWIDDVHPWKTLQSENIYLYWYRGTEEYNRAFLGAAEDARERLRNDIGAWPVLDIHIYIYGSNADMKDALVGEPDWIGGLSFGQNQRTILIGIDPGYEEWGKSTIAHELAHTTVDSIMGGCWATIPLWLNEGIAMYTEGEQEAEYGLALDEAIYYDTLFSLRSISYEYRYRDGDPILTYAESYSVVKYMIGEYGHTKIRQLLDRLGEGYSYDNALLASIGVDMDGLEDAWRRAIGADPMLKKPSVVSPTPVPESTLPSSISLLVVSTPTAATVATAAVTPASSATDVASLLEDPVAIGLICALGLLCLSCIGLVVLALVFLWKKKSASPAAERGS
jgi:hypothetical protein